MLEVMIAAALFAAPAQAQADATFEQTLALEGVMLKVGAPQADVDDKPRIQINRKDAPLVAARDEDGKITVQHEQIEPSTPDEAPQ